VSDMVRLRPLRRSEAGLVAHWERDPANAAFIVPWTEERHAASLDDPDLEHLVVEVGGAPVGFVLLTGLRNEHRSLEFRRIVSVEKGTGHGRAAVELVKQRCFTELHAQRLWLDVLETNERARALYSAAGFQEEGVLRESLRSGDGFASLVVMSMLASELEAGAGAPAPPREPRA